MSIPLKSAPYMPRPEDVPRNGAGGSPGPRIEQGLEVSEPPVGWQPVPSAKGKGTFQGFTPKYAMEGFDFNREQDPAKSAKDAFAYLANNAPPPPIADKNALGIWFQTYIQPGMKELGHNVTDVDGDKFRFNNWQGDFWVDYGRGAGADKGALAWQADYAQGGPASQSYNHTQKAIMGLPASFQNQSQSLNPNSILGPLANQPQQQGSPDMANYYEYLQNLMR